MRLPLWIPDGEEGWILAFPNGEMLYFDNRVQEEERPVLAAWLGRRVPKDSDPP